MILFNNEILKVNSTFCGKKQIFGSSIGTLIIRDKETRDQFVKTDHLRSKRAWVRTILKDKYGKYWVSTSNELGIYDRQFRLLKTYPAKKHVSYYGHIETFFMSADQKRGYWWYSRVSLQAFSIQTMKFLHTISNLVEGKFLSSSDNILMKQSFNFLQRLMKELMIIHSWIIAQS